ncbi:RagB/SusD family nutrient uptake outer membrane protein [Chitinophaga pinensis]|nr:RagB/SusD family nutrient uptake outer membrane protein [Chitinophaga pinensis]
MTPKQTILSLLLCLLVQACSLIKADVPLDKVAGRQIFQNPDSAIAAVTGIYEGISSTSNFFSAGASVYGGLYADELVYTGLTVPITEFSNSTLNSGNTTLETIFWRNTYYFIYRTNACIEGLAASESLDAGLRNQLTGEAKFFRAFLYFYLMQFFGEVPLVTSTDQLIIETMPRIPLAVIKESIFTDLRDAKALLKENYPTSDRARANKWSAAALLARMYLYEQNWPMALQEATQIISSGTYRLVGPDSVFLLTSKEAILQIQPVIQRYNTMDGFLFIPSAGIRPSFAITTSLMSAFEPGDLRQTNWVASQNNNGITYNYPFKYRKRLDASADFKVTEYTNLLRLAEIYLIRAECNTVQGLLPAAIRDIDIIRRRAGLPLIGETQPNMNATDLMALIRHERRIEFFAESGHRWMDLKRAGNADGLMQSLKPGWKSTGLLWPIPANQIVLNPSLVQNPGYR